MQPSKHRPDLPAKRVCLQEELEDSPQFRTGTAGQAEEQYLFESVGAQRGRNVLQDQLTLQPVARGEPYNLKDEASHLREALRAQGRAAGRRNAGRAVAVGRKAILNA